MALWKETGSNPTPAASGTPLPPAHTPLLNCTERPRNGPPSPCRHLRPSATRSSPRIAGTESVIAAELAIEGKIVGGGDVRIAGRFKGDVQVDGNFRIDAGARLEGLVRAGVVVVGGELQGNIDAAKQVDVLATGVIVGDVKAASITVASGSRMRGHVEFGWDDKHRTSTPPWN